MCSSDLPSPQRKTCASLIRYTFGPDGGVVGDWTDSLGRFTIESTYPVTVDGKAACRRMGPASRVPLTIKRGDAPASADEAKTLTDTWNSLAFFKDETLCIFFVRQGGGWQTRALHDGVEARGYGQPVIWVDPSDGWTAAG